MSSGLSTARVKAAGLSLCVLALSCGRAPDATRPLPPRTLVLHDDDWLGELHAVGAGVVASHFGTWRRERVAAYRAGDMRGVEAVVYIGSRREQELPRAFLDDVRAGATPVLWAGAHVEAIAPVLGVVAEGAGAYDRVTYKGEALARRSPDGVRELRVVDAARAKALAWAERDGARTPWALRHEHLTYVAEDPFAWVSDGDRYLAFCDLLFDAIAPHAIERHRAVVRIEDVSPRTDPAQLRAIGDALAARSVPFSVALIPFFVDPAAGVRVSLREAPAVVAELEHMASRGGALVLHGVTHQRTGVTGDDYEFYAARQEPGADDVMEGPVPEDSAEWAASRVRGGLAEVEAVGLPRPLFFELPHYAGSAVDQAAIARLVPYSFQRETFFAPGAEDPRRSLSLYFPFAVDDVYGWRVVPENVGFHTASGERIAARAQKLRVVRDGVAGFFYHPTFGAEPLAAAVDEMAAAGWSFVSARSLVEGTP